MKLNKKMLGLILSGVMLFSIGCSQQTEEQEQEKEQEVKVITETKEEKEYRYEEYNKVLMDNEYMTLTLIAKAEDEHGFGYIFHAKNKTDKTVHIGTNNISINNKMVVGWGVFMDLMAQCETEQIQYFSYFEVVDDYDELENVKIEWYLYDEEGYTIENSEFTTEIE